MTDKPKKGDIWSVNFEPSRSGELGKERRPALVFQHKDATAYLDTVTLIPLSSDVKQYNSIYIHVKPSKGNGLKKDSAVLCSHIYTVNSSRLLKKIGTLSAGELIKVTEAIIAHLDLDLEISI